MGEIGPAARRIVRRMNAERGIDGQRLYFDIAGYLITAIATREAFGLPVGQYAVMRVSGRRATLRDVQDELSALALADLIVPEGQGRPRACDVDWVKDLILRSWADDDGGGRPRAVTDVAAAAALVRERVAVDQAEAARDELALT